MNSSLPPLRLPHLDPRRTGNAEEDLRNVEEFLNVVLPRALNGWAQAAILSRLQEPAIEEGALLPSGATNGEVLSYDSNTNSWEPMEGSDVWLPLTGGALTGLLAIIRALAADQALAAFVSGDTMARAVLTAGGVLELGPGGAAARDVNLYRSAANILKTDDKLVATAGLGAGNSAAASTLGTVTKKMEVFDAAGVSLGFIPIYDAIT